MSTLFIVIVSIVSFIAASTAEPSGDVTYMYRPIVQYYLTDRTSPDNLLRETPYDDSTIGDDAGQVSTRQLGLFNGIFNNRFANGNTNLNTFRPISNTVWPFVRNPNYNGLLSSFESCTAGNGQSGVCTMATACVLYGGQASSGGCSFGTVCCVNTISKCGGVVTLNNTYFQTPATQLATPTSCTTTIKLDKRLPEQKQAICQIRLDLVTFSIAQPGATTVCATDNFQVGGALNTVPTICGDNDGQHMYLHVARSDNTPGDVRLTFNLGASNINRAWNIKIAMIPCVATYLAPADCLQYFTASSGTVSSFNWKDVAATTNRQLANQKYKICFRTEVVSDKRASSLCISQCSVTSGDAFELSLVANAGEALTTVFSGSCSEDYLVFVGGSNSGANTKDFSDRYCGAALSATDKSTTPATVCSTAKPMELVYRTNGDEVDGATNNVGFCLTFQQR